MNSKYYTFFILLAGILLIFPSCNPVYYHREEPPTHLEISEKGQLAVSGLMNINYYALIEEKYFSGYASIGYSPIKHLAVQGSLGYNREGSFAFKSNSVSGNLALGTYYKFRFGDQSSLLLDFYAGNSQYIQKLDYELEKTVKVLKHSWNGNAGVHYSYGKISFSYILKRDYLDIREINLQNLNTTDIPQSAIERISMLDDVTYFQHNYMMKLKGSKLNYFFLLTSIDENTQLSYVRKNGFRFGVQYDIIAKRD